MTNKDKIKEEIERIRVKEDNSITPDQSKHYTHYHVGRRELCDTLLQFIDSLPEEPISEDLEEVAVSVIKKLGGMEPDDNVSYHEVKIFKAGAEWHEQQMMKDAVATTIVNDWQYGKDSDHAIIPAIHQRIKEFTVGDKVKIIIVKEE